ncbi:hypothetical protein Tco_1073050 [Tanacetum coccineum]
MADDDQDMEMCDDTEFLERVVQATEAAVSTQQQQLFRPPPPISFIRDSGAFGLRKWVGYSYSSLALGSGFVLDESKDFEVIKLIRLTHEENYKAVELEKKKPQKEIEIEKAKG